MFVKSEPCNHPSGKRTFAAGFLKAMFGVELQQGLRFEAIVRGDTLRLPQTHIAVILGGELLQQLQCPLLHRLYTADQSIGKLQHNHQVDSDDVGLEGADSFGTFTPLRAGNVVAKPIRSGFDTK